MPDKNADLAAKVMALKGDVEKSTALRSQAEANLNLAKKQLARVDEQLKALGVEPDQAEQQLKLMEATLDQKVIEMQASVSAEIAAYNTILTESKAALS